MPVKKNFKFAERLDNQWRRKDYKDKLYPKDRDNLQTLKFVKQWCFHTQYEIVHKELAKQIQTVHWTTVGVTNIKT